MFPLDEEPFARIEGVVDLRRRLRESAVVENVHLQYFKVTQPKASHIYARCGKCHCSLKYRQDGEMFRLIYIRSLHSHPRHRNSEHRQAKEYIKSLPINMSTLTVRALVRERFPVSNRQFYYLNKCAQVEAQCFQTLIKELDSLEYETRYQPFPLPPATIPSILLLLLPQCAATSDCLGRWWP